MALPTTSSILILSLVIFATTTTTMSGTAPSWCMPTLNADLKGILASLNWACGPEGHADCEPIQPGGACFEPDLPFWHAAYAMNSYYQRAARVSGSCDFNGVGIVTYKDPSYANCHYPSSP